ncbi:unnamed protein product [Aspergillus oryzae RIB40]|uniref:DNA, SC111 n=1 Tax=Aspergillus oryzae (strain ATCC 42149 / RIB 40) TaxID=510516 RepID=Q2U8W5_ASPOR|nr:unnamed protein product [Aspergillus oryzae RIB40]BAE62000.1 unnamed protein product [Aspergillus oryzae RIB40]
MSTAVENHADNQAATTPAATEATTNGTAPAAPAQSTDAAAASADEGRRLYIGNLAYATTEGELKEFFKNYKVFLGLPVLQAKEIINPSRFRSLRLLQERSQFLL